MVSVDESYMFTFLLYPVGIKMYTCMIQDYTHNYWFIYIYEISLTLPAYSIVLNGPENYP